MSYAFQVSYSVPFGNPLDYSQSMLPFLDETSLSEPAGIAVSTQPGRNTFNLNANPVCAGTIPGGVPVHWNCDGDTVDVGVSADVNTDGGLSVLAGYDDWDNLLYNFRTTGGFADGAHPDISPPEATPEDIAEFLDLITPVVIP